MAAQHLAPRSSAAKQRFEQLAQKKKWFAQADFSYCVLHRSKVPLMLRTKVTHLRRLLFRQQDGGYRVVRRVYLL